MSATAPNYGMKAPKEMLDLANRPGYLKERQGGNRLREFWNDLMQEQFDPRKWPDFAFCCFVGLHKDLAKLIAKDQVPDLKSTLTDFRISYVALVVLGAQRAIPASVGARNSTDHVATLELLLARGADPNLPAINGATPLHFATAIYGRPDLARILLAHGADVSARDRYGQTPLFDAMLTDELECVELLIEAGTDTDTLNADGVSVMVMGPVAARISAALQKGLRKRAGEGPAAFEKKVCDGCGTKDVPLSLCARCHTARYCSRECQRSAWKSHRAACTSFDGPGSVSLKPTYLPEGMHGSLVSTAALRQGGLGKTRDVKTASKLKIKYPKPMIVKIQAPVGTSMTEGGMLVYDKRREFIAYLQPDGGYDSYIALRKIIAEKGVSGGLKAYFAAELASKDELVVKTEVLAPQEF